MATEKDIYLITCFDAEEEETERLVNAETRNQAVHHVVRINKASAADVARVLGAGGKVEEAVE